MKQRVCRHCGQPLSAEVIRVECCVCSTPYVVNKKTYDAGRKHTCGKLECRRARRREIYDTKERVACGLCACGCGQTVYSQPSMAARARFATPECRIKVTNKEQWHRRKMLLYLKEKEARLQQQQ